MNLDNTRLTRPSMLSRSGGGANRFGLASRCTQVEGDFDEPALGTLKYAAPEQLGAIDAFVDARSDLYSVGVLLYESLAGRPPFTGDSFKALLRQHGGVEPSSLDDLDRTLDPTLVDWIERLLSKDPDDRYANAREAMRVLQARTSLELPPIDDVSEHSEDLLYHHSARETLEEAWQSAQSGGGRTLLVLGEAGVGKSFLVEQFLRDVPPLSVPTALQKAERAGDAPLSVLRRCLSGWLDDLEEKRGDEDMSRIYSGLVDVAERFPASAAPFLPPALRAEVELDTSARELERNEFHEMVATLFWRFAALAGGAILVVDDLQWLDETARRILRRVTARLDSLPLLLIGIS